ncbi:nucleobase:cation symporter-2 family protein [Acinetobacter nematophilus]|uniref:Nucleobase:cation symporter-2 family protein n=1 Tax=Acinetobacter nematophilus TaxID=2994642 RepID=A0A9X3DPS6_9GAMM|nr:nucleobase:cation symporter-2 family protein [Acinetobacter nematophilus]MCX5466198.1 nucleobase:cation symporter-2 family protein [Acinetobacter nematophilus]
MSAEINKIKPEDEVLSLGKNLTFGLQHVLTMYGGLIAAPLVVGTAIGLNAAEIALLITASILVGGVATLLQTLGLKWLGAKLPIVQGTSFAAVASMIAIGTTGGNIQTIFGAVIVSSIFGILIAPFFSKIVRFFPPIVTGSIITIIGISLLPVAIRWIMGGNPKAASWGSLENIGIAAFTLAILLLVSRFGTATMARLAVLIAIVIGTIFTIFLGVADFSKMAQGELFALPHLFAFGLPVFEISAILTMCIVSIVILTETTASLLAIGEIVDTPMDSARLANGLRADMLSSAIAPLFGSFMQCAFVQNVGLVAISGVKSRFVVATGGAILVVLGLLPIFGRIVAAIPMPVLGGAGIVLFGSVAASGIRTLAKVDYQIQSNLIIVAVSVCAGLIPLISPEFFNAFPKVLQTLFHSGITTTCIAAVMLNIFFNHLSLGKKSVKAPVKTAQTVTH